MNATAASVTSQQGALVVSAGNDVNINAGRSERSLATSSFVEDSGFLGSSSTEIRQSRSGSTAVGSTFSGTAIANATTTIAKRTAAVFESLDAASQTRWLGQTTSWRAATTELANMELQAGGKSHPLLRHGDQVELAQLQQRALTGITPDGVAGRAVDSTRWLNNEDLLIAIKSAQAEFSKNGGRAGKYVSDAGKTIGDGYYVGTSTYATTTKIEIILNAEGLLTTAYPKLP